MIGGRWCRRNRARYLAPIALAATIAGTYLIVHDASEHAHVDGGAHAGASIDSRPARTGKFAKTKYYVVKPGDS